MIWEYTHTKKDSIYLYCPFWYLYEIKYTHFWRYFLSVYHRYVENTPPRIVGDTCLTNALLYQYEFFRILHKNHPFHLLRIRTQICKINQLFSVLFFIFPCFTSINILFFTISWHNTYYIFSIILKHPSRDIVRDVLVLLFK